MVSVLEQSGARGERPGLVDWLLRARDRLLGAPRFHAFAGRFPLTRRVARRRAQTLFDLTAGFVHAQVAFACVRLQVLDRLIDGPLGTADLAARCGLPEAGAERLLRAAAALGLVARRGSRWRLAELGAALRGAPGVREMVEHHAMFYADLADPVALLRGEAGPTRLARFWAYAGTQGADPGDARTAPYSRLMAASQAMVAAEVLDAYAMGRHRSLLDVGGGHGAFVEAVAARHPHLALAVFDLPSVAESAARRFAAGPLAGRAATHGGDFRAGPLPGGHDLITLVRILHDHDDTAVRALLRAIRSALPRDGTLLIAEPLSGEAANARIADAYFGFYMLAMGSGRPRTVAEIGALLGEAGFSAPRRAGRLAPFLASVLTARPA